jgi:hypothetical protein
LVCNQVWHVILIILKLGSVQRIDPRLDWSRVGTELGLKKIRKVKNLGDLTNPAGWPGKTWSKTRLQPVWLFIFLTKTISFWFIKKLGVNLEKPMTRALDQVKITEVDPTEYHSVLVKSTRLQVLSSHPDLTRLIS